LVPGEIPAAIPPVLSLSANIGAKIIVLARVNDGSTCAPMKAQPARQRALAKLNADFQMGYCRDELRAINVEIAKAVAVFQRSWLDDRKPGEHFSTSRINSGGVN
jgi:hypothetical protein